MSALYQRLTEPGPKRILALDGGGVRGILSLALLARIEKILRLRYSQPKLTLSDYFDLIGGTSTGAIIAAALSLGKEAEWIRTKYLELAKHVFQDQELGGGLLWAKYDAKALQKSLDMIFGRIALGSSNLKTGLCIVTKRADTNSTWPFFNHPEGRYFDQNKELPLELLIRASTAAPTYFRAKTIVGKTTGGIPFKGEFLDGGISMHNNPSLLLFHLATLKGFPFRWTMDESELLLVSVGTGYWGTKTNRRGLFKDGAGWAKILPHMLMEDASWHNQLILQSLSSSPTAFTIDSEIGALEHDHLASKPLLSYLRYDVPLEREKLKKLNLMDMPFKAEKLQPLDQPANMQQLKHLGEVASGKLVHALHFPRCFDPEFSEP